jgi:FKBP-type peptidyl-prolyl cis-trans isomerase FklB
MNYFVVICAIVLSVNTCLAEENSSLRDKKDKISYSIGYQVGGDFKMQKIDLRPEILIKGMQDAMAGSEPRMTPEEMRTTLTDLQKKIAAEMEEKKKNAK